MRTNTEATDRRRHERRTIANQRGWAEMASAAI